MSALSEFLRQQGINPFVAGLVCGIILLGVLFVYLRGIKFPNLSIQVNRVSGPTDGTPAAGSPAAHGIAINRTVKFRVKVNGVEKDLSDDVTASLISALKSGDKEDAIALLQTATGMEPNAAKNVIDAMEKTTRL